MTASPSRALACEPMLQAIGDTVPQPLLVLDEALRVQFANRAFCDTFRIAASSTIGRSMFELGEGQWNIHALRQLLEQVLPSRFPAKVQIEHKFPATGRRVMLINARRLSVQGPEDQRIILAIDDVTERRRAEERLRESEQLFRLIVESATDYAIITMDMGRRVTSWNTGAARMLGFSDQEIVGQSADRLFAPEDRVGRQPEREASMTLTAGRAENERWHVRKDGTRFWASGLVMPLHDEVGQVCGFLKIMQDRTGKKQAEERLEASLKEKEVLLKEIHHRVRNNLQIISSLLNIQAHGVEDPRIAELFTESQDRIRSMALVHEKLYGAKDLAEVDMAAYIESLARHLFGSYGRAERIDLHLEVDDVRVPIDAAMPCGLVLNELISNALKHAFPGGRRGGVWITLQRRGEAVVIVVKDDGIGIPERVDPLTTELLGLHLVRTLVGQLDGSLALQREGGTIWTIELPRMRD